LLYAQVSDIVCDESSVEFRHASLDVIDLDTDISVV
jgi:hypothetical protein